MSDIQLTNRPLNKTDDENQVDVNDIKVEFWKRSKRAKREPNPDVPSCQKSL